MKKISVYSTIVILTVICVASILAYAYISYQSSFISNLPPPQSQFTLYTGATVLPNNFDATKYWSMTDGNYIMPLTIVNDGNSTFTPTISFFSSDGVNWTETMSPYTGALITVNYTDGSSKTTGTLAPIAIGNNITETLIVAPLTSAHTTLFLNVTVSS